MSGAETAVEVEVRIVEGGETRPNFRGIRVLLLRRKEEKAAAAAKKITSPFSIVPFLPLSRSLLFFSPLLRPK